MDDGSVNRVLAIFEMTDTKASAQKLVDKYCAESLPKISKGKIINRFKKKWKIWSNSYRQGILARVKENGGRVSTE